MSIVPLEPGWNVLDLMEDLGAALEFLADSAGIAYVPVPTYIVDEVLFCRVREVTPEGQTSDPAEGAILDLVAAISLAILSKDPLEQPAVWPQHRLEQLREQVRWLSRALCAAYSQRQDEAEPIQAVRRLGVDVETIRNALTAYVSMVCELLSVQRSLRLVVELDRLRVVEFLSPFTRGPNELTISGSSIAGEAPRFAAFLSLCLELLVSRDRSRATLIQTLGVFAPFDCADRLLSQFLATKMPGAPPDLVLPGVSKVLLCRTTFDRFASGEPRPAYRILRQSLLVHEHAHAAFQTGRRTIRHAAVDWNAASPLNEGLAEWLQWHFVRAHPPIRRLLEEHAAFGPYPEWPYSAAAVFEQLHEKSGIEAVRRQIQGLRDNPRGAQARLTAYVDQHWPELKGARATTRPALPSP